MARFSANQIYALARSVGFSPDQSATMTAIALAESGGNDRAHNPVGEDSQGLWQINARAHPDLDRRYDLYDPAQNAKAAYEVSGHGDDVSPWTTTHGGASARYLRYRSEAEAAALAYGDGSGRGVWTGTAAYGDPLSAGPGSGAPSATEAVDGTDGSGTESSDAFLQAALSQRGDPYDFGAEASASDADPAEFDCSELTEWAAAQAGITIPDGASAQYLWAKDHGYLVPVSEAQDIPGALLFNFSSEPVPGGGRPSTAHVAISLGRDKTIEARGTAYGVNEFSSAGRFTYAAAIPGLVGGDPDTTAPDNGNKDPDRDDLDVETERKLGLDPFSADTDRDGVSDGHEVNTVHSNPRRAYTDSDQLSDAFEISHGLDPTDPDTDDDGILDGAFAPTGTDVGTLDADLDRLLDLDSAVSDADSDGFADGLEVHSGSDPLSADSTPLHPVSTPDHDPADDGLDDFADDH